MLGWSGFESFVGMLGKLCFGRWAFCVDKDGTWRVVFVEMGWEVWTSS